jgi:tetratricopeptide (TPR) repeat protein
VSRKRSIVASLWALALTLAAAAQTTRPDTAPSASEAVAQARASMQAGEFQAAYDKLQAAFQAHRRDLEVNLLLAEWQLVAGDPATARAHADIAEAVAPNDFRSALMQGHALFRIGEGEAESANVMSQASFTEAAMHYEEARRLGAPEYDSSFWAADARARGRDLPAALANVARALAARPGDLPALGLQGRLLVDSGRALEAVPILTEVAEKAAGTPAGAEAAVALVRTQAKLGGMDALAALVEKFTRGDRFGVAQRVWQVAFDALHGTKNEDAWSAMLEAAAAAAPGDAVVAWYQAELAIRRGPPASALAFAERYLALRPGDADAHLFRAVALRQLGRLDEARQSAGKAYDIDPEQESTRSEYRYLVAAFFDAKRYKDAADVQQLVVHFSGTAADRHDYAVLRLDAGMKDDAERLYREIAADAAAPASERARAWNALALLLGSSARLDDAEKAFRKALAEDGGLLDAHENLGILLVRKGAVEEGRRELEAAIAGNKDAVPRKRAAYHLWRAGHPELP